MGWRQRHFVNPNGISCDRCGFINTPRATLSTGGASLAPTASTSTDPSDNGACTITQGAKAHDDHRRAGRDLKHASGALRAYPFGEAFGERRRWRDGKTKAG
ncbi:filamentous hemagglutinin N-terminal domain-containing protein (plasmid) [Mesorhizobium sp. AR10]|nr:filamentous hemagglutinin N-terminal domain-containing protein [Mesorhizobium sp. AR10]